MIDEVLKDAVVIKKVSGNHYFVQVLGKPMTSVQRKRDAEMQRAEWLTALSGLVVKTANACSNLIGDPKAASIIVEAIAAPLEKLGFDGYKVP